MPTTRKPAAAKAAPQASQTSAFPWRIGQALPDGSLYAGLCRGADGQPDYHLALSPAKPEARLPWKKALAWAESLGEGWHVPTRDESALLYAFLRDEFEPGWHWTSSQSSAAYAWSQTFHDGLQGTYGKSYEARARAVRRFDAQSFDPSKAAA